MEQQHHDAIKKIVQFTKQDSEFDMELRKALDLPSVNNTLLEDERLKQIYEYCIERNAKEQAEGFYRDFPLSTLTDELEEDFVKMEFYHRKNNFKEFCLALYQQIEGITNKLCENKDLTIITEKMWGHLAYVTNSFQPDNFERRCAENASYQIAKLIFGDKGYERSKASLQSLYANEKMKVIVYFLGYKTMMKSNDYNAYKEMIDTLSYIYTFRNFVHKGGTPTVYEKNVYNKIMPLKSFYYFKFVGMLAQYVEFVRNGYDSISILKKYAENIQAKSVIIQSPKILGKITLPEGDLKKKNRDKGNSKK